MRLNYIDCCDNVQGLQRLPDNCIDLTVTSPPYDNLRDYKGFSWDFEALAAELYRVTKPGGMVVWVVGDSVVKGSKTLTSFKQALHFKEIGFNVYDVILYEKAGASPPNKRRYFNSFEYMLCLSKGIPNTVNLLKDKPNRWAGTTSFGTVSMREKDGSLTKKKKMVIAEYGVRTNIWRYANGWGYSTKYKDAHKHPAIFPEQLAIDHVLSWSNPGDVVLDPFMGSGTTAVACLRTGRNYIGFELSREYCDIAEQRIAAEMRQQEEEWMT